MRSKAYWVRRTAALEAVLQAAGNAVSDDIIQAYEQAIENINADIHQTFKAYVATEIPEGEAEKLLNAAENDKLYQELLQLYEETNDPQTKAEILNRINAQAYGARISRLEGVKARVYIQLRRVANYAEKAQKTLYTNTLQSSYYTNIYNIAEGLNCGIDFTLLPQRAIDKVLREPWHGKNYSERIWIHNDRFIETVQDTITTGIISGHSVNRMAESLTEYVKEGKDIRSSTDALVRTETSHFMNQGQKSAYEEIGIKKYRYVAALSERTCERCAALDGETFEVDKAVEGENYPPLHPNCRCVTIMADAIPSTRIARDPETGKNYKVDGNMTFEEWKNSLTDEQRKAMELHVRQMKNKSADKKQYEKYISVIGKENMPKTFDAFQNLKYNDIKQWGLLKDYKQSRSSNMISAFTSFDDYKIYKQKINDELIGIITSDGVEIKSQSKHFIERVFGTSEDPNTKRPRNGVEIEDIKDALLNGTKKHRKDSLRYFGDKCVVSVNKNSGILIQTNPK